MADANITKRALAASLQDLMKEVPFEKINVTRICEKCGMNRKSFYYHFRDKYDLVNWIFDTNFTSILSSVADGHFRDDQWMFLEKICEYFYEYRDFYRKMLLVSGQNSLSEHFREFILPGLKVQLSQRAGGEGVDDFTAGFFADAILLSIKRWLMEKDCMVPDQFVRKIKRIVHIYNRDGAPGAETQQGDSGA